MVKTVIPFDETKIVEETKVFPANQEAIEVSPKTEDVL
jgi:hypothetical protein